MRLGLKELRSIKIYVIALVPVCRLVDASQSDDGNIYFLEITDVSYTHKKSYRRTHVQRGRQDATDGRGLDRHRSAGLGDGRRRRRSSREGRR